MRYVKWTGETSYPHLLITLLTSSTTLAGYYLATLEAATQHILDLGQQYEQEVLFHSGGAGAGAGGAEESVRADFDDFAS